MNTSIHIKNILLAVLSAVGTAIATFLGGWDMSIQTLILFMTVDFCTGLIVALVFKQSKKSVSGSIDGKAFLKGFIKKLAILSAVGVCVLLDNLLNTPMVCRTAIILFFIGNEGISICENAGLMGVPLPKFLKKALETLKEENNGGYKNE